MRLPRPTLRLRLTLVWFGFFLVAGLALLGVTYLLFRNQLPWTLTPPAIDGGRNLKRVIVNNDVVLTGEAADQLIQAQVEEVSRSFFQQGAVAFLLVAVVAFASAWVLTGRMLAPLHRVTATARRIAAERGLQQRIHLHGPDDEVKELADTFDGMVERLEHAFDGQRRFVANASHELRTPLTLNRALVELAMHRRTASPDVIRLGEDLLKINTRHERLISGLLLLARSEQELPAAGPVDLADVVSHVAEQTAAEATAAGVRVTVAAGPAPTCGDGLLLEQLVRNLVENGIRHNNKEPTDWVRVESGPNATITVTNSGPVVPAYDVAALFEPFRRGDGDRVTSSHGAGLGLSIVRSVARAHGGAVDARPRDGGGLVVTVRLPDSSPEPGPDSSPCP
ncbi:two-component sensor histidine kinase [Actinoplanes philippinensis]|uniref:histidine kinase n=1 Tax=Actinoplanes philippinensis TaxID=35752 RepID=A0A1I2H6U1_9ACTN|nr:HAMP domain-containing sensor histidine kinase [Actinoplanes philippinensis]GIE78379.1 two-component sensor histidine kinase [Actinoplanes philippinensis]SFF24496.1 Signal transduction histidine kinase [Actinoplanes philippinensis]